MSRRWVLKAINGSRVTHAARNDISQVDVRFEIKDLCRIHISYAQLDVKWSADRLTENQLCLGVGTRASKLNLGRSCT